MLLFFSLSLVKAQEKWSFEFRPNLDFSTTKIGAESIGTGFGFDANISYNFIKNTGIYAGWGWNSYRVKNIPNIEDFDLNQTGYTFGFQYIHSIKESPLGYFVRLGSIYAHVEAENDAGINIAETGHEFGWEATAGIYLFNVSSFSLRPQVGYRHFSGDFNSDFNAERLKLHNFFIGIGVVKSF